MPVQTKQISKYQNSRWKTKNIHAVSGFKSSNKLIIFFVCNAVNQPQGFGQRDPGTTQWQPLLPFTSCFRPRRVRKRRALKETWCLLRQPKQDAICGWSRRKHPTQTPPRDLYCGDVTVCQRISSDRTLHQHAFLFLPQRTRRTRQLSCRVFPSRG